MTEKVKFALQKSHSINILVFFM